MLHWSIDCALACHSVDRVIVTTDDPEIRDAASRLGAEAPFLRPTDLAADETSDLPVYRHALSWLAEHEHYAPELVAWLRPTSPLRRPDDVDRSLAILQETRADAVRAVCLVEHHPEWMRVIEDSRLRPLLETRALRRQDLPPVYRLTGAVDCVRVRADGPVAALFDEGDVRPYEMPPERSVDIDSEFDLLVADALVQRQTG